MTEIVDMGTVSSRGQIAIPSDIRQKMRLEKGTKVFFLLTNNTLIIKRINPESFGSITEPLKKAMKRTRLSESDVPSIVHRVRKRRK